MNHKLYAWEVMFYLHLICQHVKQYYKGFCITEFNIFKILDKGGCVKKK